MFYAVARDPKKKPICAIRFDRKNNQMLLIGAKTWLDTLEQLFRTAPSIGWIIGQDGDKPLQQGLGAIPQMRYFAEGEGEDDFNQAMSEMGGAEVRSFEPRKAEMLGDSDGK